MGFLGPEKYIAEELATKMDGRGNYETPVGKYETSVPGIFAAGGNTTNFETLGYDFIKANQLQFLMHLQIVEGVSLW